jgi:hypothetical protein
MSLRGLLASSAVLLVLLTVPLVTSAQNAAAGANAECAAKCKKDAAIANSTQPPRQELNCIGLGGMVPETCTYSGPGGTVQGMCLVGMVCQAQTANGKGVDSGLQQLGQILGQLLSKLGQSSGSGSGSGSTPTGLTGCTSSYFFTSDVTQIGSNPCAQYQAATTCNDTTATNFGQSGACIYNNGNNTSTSSCSLLQQINGTCSGGTPTPGPTGDTLLATPTSGSAPLSVTFSTIPSTSDTGPFSINFGDGSNNTSMTQGTCPQTALSGGAGSCQYNATHTYPTAGTFSATLLDANGNTLASANISVQNPGAGSGSTGFSQVLNNVGNMLLGGSTTPQGGLQGSPNFPGVFGNILLNTNGATIFASTINPSSNSQISGFFGSATFSGQPQSAAGQLCVTRPWATNFLADVIPPSFFDSLCEWGGYQVGQPPAPQPQVTLQQTVQTAKPQPVATTTAPTTAPQAEIWAVPSAVPLGARTSVFWNTQGVTSCTETSPDGSFSENSLAGAASTVPLTGSTTYTISCTDSNGNPVTNYTTVNISS